MSQIANRPWSVESFRTFWANPDPGLLPGVRTILTDDIVGYWPRPIGIVRGAKAYAAVIDAVVHTALEVGFTLRIGEHAATGDCTFIRWIAKVQDVPEFSGCDRIRVRDGKACENYIFADHPFFELVAKRLRAEADAA